jgi:putative transposase
MFRPWVTFLLDSHTRFILACIVTEGDGVRGDPGTESLVALLAAAIRGTDAADGTFVGGVPAVVQFDNAKAHLAKAMVNGYLELGVATHAIKPGSPWEDGRVERLMLTFSKELLVTLPGYTKALPDRYEHEPWIPEGCLTVEEFTAHLQEWIDIYNYERHHDALGMTPFEAWKEDSTPIRRVSNDLIRHGFLAETTGRKISKNGIRFNNVDFVHAALGKLVGKKVTIRHLPNDRSFIDVHLNGQFLCTAIPYARLSQDDRKQIVRDRNSQIRQTDRIIKRSGTRARQRELEGNPLLSPERNPSVPQRKVDDMSEEEFLVFVEETAGIGKEDDHDHNA